jgi:hypothetical protein
MAEVDRQPEQAEGSGLKPWQSKLVAGLLIVAGILHAVKPAWLNMDWPSIALIFVGLLLLFVPLNDIGGIIESLEIGKTKILFRKVKGLDESVKDAERQQASTESTTAQASFRVSGHYDNGDEQIEALLSADKEMALVRIGIEIERVLTDLFQAAGGTVPRTGIVWSRAIEFLESRGDLVPAT